MTNVHRGQTVSNLTSLLDVYPTLLEMAQAQINDTRLDNSEVKLLKMMVK